MAPSPRPPATGNSRTKYSRQSFFEQAAEQQGAEDGAMDPAEPPPSTAGTSAVYSQCRSPRPPPSAAHSAMPPPTRVSHRSRGRHLSKAPKSKNSEAPWPFASRPTTIQSVRRQAYAGFPGGHLFTDSSLIRKYDISNAGLPAGVAMKIERKAWREGESMLGITRTSSAYSPPRTARESSRARSKLDEPPTDEPLCSSRGLGDDSDSYLTRKFGEGPRPVMAQRRVQHGMEGIKSAAGSGWEPKKSSRGQRGGQLPSVSAVGSMRSQRPATRGVAQTAR